jgi:hypothetical protein
MKKIIQFIRTQFETKPFGGIVGISIILIFSLLMILGVF